MRIFGRICLVIGVLSFIGAASQGHSIFGPIFWIGLGIFLLYKSSHSEPEKIDLPEEKGSKPGGDSEPDITNPSDIVHIYPICPPQQPRESIEEETEIQSELTLQQREAAMRLVVYIRECNDILLDTPLYLIYQRAFTFFGISLEADEIYRLKHKYDVDITLIDIINSIKSRKAKDFLLQTCYNLIKPTGDFELLGSLYEISKEIGYQKSEVTRLLFAKVNSDETLRKISEIEDEVESKVNEILKNEKRLLGVCHTYWSTKKRILLVDYGIEWFTPAECNPDIMYD